MAQIRLIVLGILVTALLVGTGILIRPLILQPKSENAAATQQIIQTTTRPSLADFIFYGVIEKFDADERVIELKANNPYPQGGTTIYNIYLESATQLSEVKYLSKNNKLDSFHFTDLQQDFSQLKPGTFVRISGARYYDQQTRDGKFVASIVAIDKFS